MLRFLPIALVAVGGALALPAGAQTDTSDSADRPTVVVPLPNGDGIFYYRSGSVGDVVVRSRRPAPPAPPPAAALPAGTAPAASVRQSERGADGVSQLDLLALERSILDAIDRRLAERGYTVGRTPSAQSPQAPIVVLPAAPGAQPSPVTPERPPVADQPLPPVRPQPPRIPPPPGPPGPPPPSPPSSEPPTVREVERQILETGLFRTTAVNFEFARAELLPVSARTLDVVADVLRRYPDLRIEIGGHTDSVGSDAVNDPLSQRRAQSVVDYLVAVGVSPARLSAVGYGERRPVADNSSETGRALNRRVEFTVLNPDAVEGGRVADPEPSDLREIIRQEIERARDGE